MALNLHRNGNLQISAEDQGTKPVSTDSAVESSTDNANGDDGSAAPGESASPQPVNQDRRGLFIHGSLSTFCVNINMAID